MIKPHDTEQYGHVLRVSVVRAILSARISARASSTSNPNAIVVPIVVALRKPRRVSSIEFFSERRTTSEIERGETVSFETSREALSRMLSAQILGVPLDRERICADAVRDGELEARGAVARAFNRSERAVDASRC
jgi:hypothetical protein